MEIDVLEDDFKPVKLISFKGKRKTYIVDLDFEEEISDQDTDDLEEE